MLKMETSTRKFHAIPRFPAGPFAVYIGDHLRSNLGIVSVRGSFTALYSTPPQQAEEFENGVENVGFAFCRTELQKTMKL